MIVAIDPGSTNSALLVLRGLHPTFVVKEANDAVLNMLREESDLFSPRVDLLVLEMVASYGMAVGAEVFETVRWLGRFQEAWARRGGKVELVYRKDVKMHLCHNTRAKDTNVRAALIDLFGGKDAAIGKKARPGPLYGIKADLWSALALALTAYGRSEVTL